MAAARKPLISGNWKMNLNHFEAITLVQKLSYLLRDADYEAVEVAIHPPFTDLRSVQTVLDVDRIPIALGAQDCHWEDAGAHTGEVSPAMLAKLHVSYVIVGHSERRGHGGDISSRLAGETDEVINRKVHAVLRHGMTPILAVGETLVHREAGRADDAITAQLTAGTRGLTRAQAAGLVVAYEPVWAIGSGRVATPGDAQHACAVIRGQFAATFGAAAADGVRIIYGGSVKPVHTAALMTEPDVDGALVGGASLNPDDFARIIQYRLTP